MRPRKVLRRLSAGVIVVRRQGSEWRFLMLRAFRNWDFPKGLAEAGEAPLETARREVAEGTGITELYFAWGEVYVETPPYAGGKVARYYIGETTKEQVHLLAQSGLRRPSIMSGAGRH